jgi:hypothetical protein
MPRLRKPEPVMLNDDELYAVMRATFQHPKVPQWKPEGYELGLLENAYKKIAKEFYARAKEDQRISDELELIRVEYEG